MQRARTKMVLDELSRREEALTVATSSFAAVTALVSLGFTCMLWRRVNQLQSMLHSEAMLHV
jgi:hypothetical protein